MIDAYMICDFNNPVSMQYVELSLKSFEPVSDIVNITPVQCTTPNTLPIRHGENEPPIPHYIDRDDLLAGRDRLRPRFFGGSFCDSPIYNCVMHSHWQLIKRIAEGEPIAIMEHDAALVDEESFRNLIDVFWGQVEFFCPGACMEFYGMTQDFAKWMYELLDDFPHEESQRYSGPMGVISRHYLMGWERSSNFLVPTKFRDDLDLICYSPSIDDAQDGFVDEHFKFKPACKQFYFRNKKNTNDMEYLLAMGDTGKCPTTGVRHRDFVYIDD